MTGHSARSLFLPGWLYRARQVGRQLGISLAIGLVVLPSVLLAQGPPPELSALAPGAGSGRYLALERDGTVLEHSSNLRVRGKHGRRLLAVFAGGRTVRRGWRVGHVMPTLRAALSRVPKTNAVGAPVACQPVKSIVAITGP